jgi:acyl-CoA dehydrogenase
MNDLYGRTRALAAEVLAPIAEQGRPGHVNRPLVRALAEHGLLARLFPKVSATDLCVIREALATACT